MAALNPLRYLLTVGFACWCAGAPSAQVVNRESVEALLGEGEIDKAEKALSSYWASVDLTYQDSIFLLKNLGVLYASTPKKKDQGERCFRRLLEMDPFASIHDTYASNTILARFKKIKREHQNRKGGRALIPSVAVFDFDGAGLRPGDGAVMAQQFIAEMQRMDIFHTLDRSNVTETLGKMRLTPEKCQSRECRLDIARRLTADKIVTVDMGRVDSVFSFTLVYADVETGQTGTTLHKVFKKPLERVLGDGFGELAAELQENEAAWLNLTITPVNTILTIDGSPMAAISSRVALNPGKHQVCGSSPGYESACKDFEVKRNDALTYALALAIKGEGQSRARQRHPEDDDEDDYAEAAAPDAGAHRSSGKLIWWTLGSMAVAVATLAVVFNAKD